MRSYLVGSTPENNYTPVQPYRVTVSENTYSRTQFVDGYLTLYVACSGADSPRPAKAAQQTIHWAVVFVGAAAFDRHPYSAGG